jgi:periplasmic divalent cation tolerance protein
MAFAKEHHPYDTPALLWFETDDADPTFADWIAEVTRAP